ncbi:MAG: HlyD family secretion protein, partial [Deltaproteobacteria bacterium]|nr:HlyD family secretion protein [Deltaproteobacteria bacterium]
KAQLVETEAYVAQLKEGYDAARANTKETRTKLALSELRVEQHQRLARTGAGSRFELERYETEVESTKQQLAASEAQENQALLGLTAEVGDRKPRVAQVLAQLESAQFDLENTDVKAPAAGMVTMNMLRPGMQVPPKRSVMTFIYTDDVAVLAVFPQKTLEHIRVGDSAQLSFAALPGRIFEGEVRNIPSAIGEAQIAVAGLLPRAGEQRMTRLYPVVVTLPDEFPREQIRHGLAARVYIMTENAGPLGFVATILHWVQSSMDYVI